MVDAPVPEPSPLDSALARVGDRWAFLVVDTLLGGAMRFGDLQSHLSGVSPNVLTRRLRDLEQAGVVVTEPYSQRPRRHRYRLTAVGRDLAPALAELARWGERFDSERTTEAGGSVVDDGDGADDGNDEELHYA